MWRRTYLFLVLVRLWFALSPSYLHPDENFQGPEVIAGEIFSYPVRRTWEFTNDNPIRSVFPLWPVYGLPMLLLRWLWVGNGKDGEIPPIAVFWTLRVLMFIVSFVLEDWAIHEHIQSQRHRRLAVLLVASSYVTWTFQTHTFSNSIETLVVAWSLVLIERIVASPLIGPAALLLFMRPKRSLRLYSAISGIIVLSLSQHQEARFLLPTVPLILSSIRLPKNEKVARIWVGVWIIFNITFGTLMGVYHQGGVVPAQVFMSKQPDATQAIWWKTYMPPIWLLNGKNEVLRTQDVMGMEGELLLAELDRIATCDTPADRRSMEYLKEKNGTYLVAPLSATWLDPYLLNKGLEGLRFREVWRYRQHLNLDDLDFAEDGFGMYVMFPIGIMYYFGTNLDNRFQVPDFWPKPENANKVPLERDEIHAELERLRTRRLQLREQRLAAEARAAAFERAREEQQQQQEQRGWMSRRLGFIWGGC
ncbi:alpha 1,2 mannosyltransferase [Collariella sp. IMI 366227]|nr:alpha 1,2 mannosyltransferase [Collariella sp. IMI 366227]